MNSPFWPSALLVLACHFEIVKHFVAQGLIGAPCSTPENIGTKSAARSVSHTAAGAGSTCRSSRIKNRAPRVALAAKSTLGTFSQSGKKKIASELLVLLQQLADL